MPISRSLIEGGFVSPLWPFIEQTAALIKVMALLVGISLLLLLIASAKAVVLANMVAAFAVALLLISCSLAGAWQYRRNRRSLRTILRFFQMTAWPFAFSLIGFVVAVGTATGSVRFYAAHWVVILGVFLAMLCLLSGTYIAYRPRFRDQYRAFATYRATGTIPADDLYEILSQGRSSRVASRMAAIVGISVPLFAVAGIALSNALHRDIRETLAFCMSFFLSGYLMAVLIARRWLQWRYLGRSDLMVVD